MRAVPIVEVCPDRQVGCALVRGLVGARIGPFAQGGLDEPFRLAVGLWRVRSGADVAQAEFGAGGLEGAGFVA